MLPVLVNCGGEPPLTTSNSPSVSNPTVGVTQEAAAYVRVYDTGTFPYYTHTTGSFSQACEIATTAASQNLDCIVDMNELDIYYHGVSLQANFPSSMCTYVVHNPYWHYNFETGYGPAAITVTKTTLNGTVTGTSCVIDGVATCDGLEASYSASEGVQCKYDHTKIGGPNCCLDFNGTSKYVLTVTTNEVGTSPSTTTTSSQQSWGGNVKNCLGGQARTDWTLHSKQGYPLGEIIYSSGVGYNKAFKISPVIKTSGTFFTLPIANYYKPYNASTPPNHRHLGYNTTPTRTSDIPYMIDPIDDRNFSPMVDGNPSYQWLCLDRDYEVKHSINVYVRDWNTYAQFLLYGTSAGASGNPDVTGSEGTNCDYSAGTGRCDDLFDLDNTATPSGYTAPLFDFIGPHTSTNRFYYFPTIPYN